MLRQGVTEYQLKEARNKVRNRMDDLKEAGVALSDRIGSLEDVGSTVIEAEAWELIRRTQTTREAVEEYFALFVDPRHAVANYCAAIPGVGDMELDILEGVANRAPWKKDPTRFGRILNE